jgi:hypothetical protein
LLVATVAVAGWLRWKGHENREIAEGNAAERAQYEKALEQHNQEMRRRQSHGTDGSSPRQRCERAIQARLAAGKHLALVVLRVPNRTKLVRYQVAGCQTDEAGVLAGRWRRLRRELRKLDKVVKTRRTDRANEIYEWTFRMGHTATLWLVPTTAHGTAAAEQVFGEAAAPTTVEPAPPPVAPEPAEVNDTRYDQLSMLVLGAGVLALVVILLGQIMRTRRRKTMGTELPCTTDTSRCPAPQSLFDIFWGLGASDYALEILRVYELRPRGPADIEELDQRFSRLLTQFHNYDTFIEHHQGAFGPLVRASGEVAGAKGQLQIGLPPERFSEVALTCVPHGHERTVGILDPLVWCIETRDHIASRPAEPDPNAAVTSSRGEVLFDAYMEIELIGAAMKQGCNIYRYWQPYSEADAHLSMMSAESAKQSAATRKSTLTGTAGYDPDADSAETIVIATIEALLGHRVSGKLATAMASWFGMTYQKRLEDELTERLGQLYQVWLENEEQCRNNLHGPAQYWGAEAERIRRAGKRTRKRTNPVERLMLGEARAAAKRIQTRLAREASELEGKVAGHVKRGAPHLAGGELYICRAVVFHGLDLRSFFVAIRNTCIAIKQEVLQLESHGAL